MAVQHGRVDESLDRTLPWLTHAIQSKTINSDGRPLCRRGCSLNLHLTFLRNCDQFKFNFNLFISSNKRRSKANFLCRAPPLSVSSGGHSIPISWSCHSPSRY